MTENDCLHLDGLGFQVDQNADNRARVLGFWGRLASSLFALGNGLLVTPVLTEGATIVTGYFPEMASSMIGTLEPRNRLPQAKDA
ncbi:hypothetical protein V1522DRAFT_423857 [Lipomyces starkeyi]